MSNIVKAQQAPIEPSNLSELRTLANDIAKSGLSGAKTPEQALFLMMTGRDLGLSYAQAARAFHFVSGKPTLSADAMVAVCLSSGKCDYFRTIESTDERCTVETRRAGQDPQRVTFTMADAKRAGLLSNPTWSKYPSAMLRARAKAALARDAYPDLLLGIYDPEEIESTQQAQPQPVRVEVRQAKPEPSPQALPTAPAQSGEVPVTELTDDERTELYEELCRLVDGCQSMEELEMAEIDLREKAPDLYDGSRAALVHKYKSKKAALKSSAAA